MYVRSASGQEAPDQAREVLAAENRPAPDTIEDRLVELMKAYEKPIYNFLVVLLHDNDCALDCAQDCFLRAFQNLAKGRPVNRSWLYTVARNLAMDEFRKRKHVQRDLDELEKIPCGEHMDRVVAVRQVMEQLTPRDREVLYLFDVAGFKTDEIGHMLGARGSAIRQRLCRARERFRALYGAEL